MTNTKALTFRDTTFHPINCKGQQWLTATEIATALGYVREDAVSRIYDRRKEEFTPAMSETVKLTVSGNLQKEVRIFSLRGAHLLGMLARTERAAEFRRWVLDILDQQTPPPVAALPALPPVTTDLTTRFVTAANALYNVLHVHSHYAEARFMRGFLCRVERAQASGKSAHFTPDDVAQCRAAADKALDRMYAHKVVNFQGYRVIEDYLDRLALHVASPDAVTARVEAEIHHRVHFSRFVLRMEDDGLLRLQELPLNAHIVTAEDFAKHVATLDRKDLPAVIAAAVARLT